MPAHNVVRNLEAAMGSDWGDVLDISGGDLECATLDVNTIQPSTGSAVSIVSTAISLQGIVAITGNVTAASSVGTSGYGTGAGGAVTQATSKSTGVTLSKPCGQITMHNASLAAGASVSFAVTNTLVTATDTVIIHRVSGGTDGSYSVRIDKIAAGSFTVTLVNESVGALAEAVVLNFAVIRAVAA